MRLGRRLHAAYTVAVGLFMGGFWGVLYVNGGIPELQTAPIEIGYHLLAELLTAAALVASGVGLLLGQRWSRRLTPVALGMLLYTVINSAGYYAQMGDLAMVGMFTVLTTATIALLIDYVSSEPADAPDQGNSRVRPRMEEFDV